MTTRRVTKIELTSYHSRYIDLVVRVCTFCVFLEVLVKVISLGNWEKFIQISHSRACTDVSSADHTTTFLFVQSVELLITELSTCMLYLFDTVSFVCCVSCHVVTVDAFSFDV